MIDLQAVADALSARGLTATVEYPGFVAIPHATMPTRTWCFGTANELWGGELADDDGEVFDYLETDIPSTSTDADAVAQAIAAALMTPKERP